jgi:hypothetical protein
VTADPLVVGVVSPASYTQSDAYSISLLSARDGKREWKAPSELAINQTNKRQQIQVLLISATGEQLTCG